MRLFVSIDLPQEVMDYISLLGQDLLAQNLFEGRLTKPEQLHLTLQFIGEVSDEKAVAIQGALQSIKMPSFSACLGALGVFPAVENVRIIWIGLQAPELTILSKKIHAVLKPLVKLDDRSFVNHITIARVKKVNDFSTLQAYFESIRVDPLCFTVNEFVLKRSDLSSLGAQHALVESYFLQ